MLDLTGLSITLALLALYPHELIVAILPIAIAALYAVSCVYHWLPSSVFRQKLDHVMIAVVIAVTYVPFWWILLPQSEARFRIFTMTVLFFGVCLLKSLFIEWQITGGIVFLVMGLFGTIISFNDLPVWLPFWGLSYFWLGLVLYLLQLIVYGAKKPNPVPDMFAFREVQHLILIAATSLHTFTVLNYL